MTAPYPGNEPLTLTSHELQFMFSLEDSATARANHELLNLPAAPEDSGILGAGAATLLVRGLAVVAEGKFALTEESGVVGYVLTHAAVWTEIGLSSADVSDGALLLTADDLTLLFTPRPMGIFDVMAVDPQRKISDVILPLASTFLDEGDNRLAVVRSAFGGGERSAAVMRTAESRWRTAVDIPRPADDGGGLRESDYVDADREAALKLLSSVVAS